VIPLNVAELIEDELHHPSLMGLGEALENFDKHFATTNDDTDVDGWEAAVEATTARYTCEYQLYSERFARAAQYLAGQIPGLIAEVYIKADTNPTSSWWSSSTINNPHDMSDRLAQQLWRAAHDATSLPNVDIWRGAVRDVGEQRA
jgi:hypothetical protein